MLSKWRPFGIIEIQVPAFVCRIVGHNYRVVGPRGYITSELEPHAGDLIRRRQCRRCGRDEPFAASASRHKLVE